MYRNKIRRKAKEIYKSAKFWSPATILKRTKELAELAEEGKND